MTYMGIDEIPRRRGGLAVRRATWVPWHAVDRIPAGQALGLTKYLGGRKVRVAYDVLAKRNSWFSRNYPHLRVVKRGERLFLAHAKGRQLIR